MAAHVTREFFNTVKK